MIIFDIRKMRSNKIEIKSIVFYFLFLNKHLKFEL